MNTSDILEIAIASYRGSSATHKAKVAVLGLLRDVEATHAKIEKLVGGPEGLTGFLDKCIMSATKPKLLRDIGELGIRVEECKGLLADARSAEEKRVARAEARAAKKVGGGPVAVSKTVKAPVGAGEITIHVHVGGSGSTGVSTGGTDIGGRRVKKTGNPYKKKGIPKNVRNQTWNRYIGKEKGEAPCYCCGIHMIDKAAFEAGHVVPEVRGGPSTIENLRPICGACNRSMGDTDMREYALRYYGKVLV